MPDQDGLRFLFDIQDKITAKLARIEAKAKSSAAKIDKAFTRASKSQQANTSKAIAAEQRRIIAVEKAHTKAVALLKRESDAFKRSMTRMASAATVAFAAVAAKAIQMAGGYDAAMRSVQAKTGATGELMDRLSEQSREMGRTTVHSATEAARGQAFLAQAGFDVHEVLEALPATLALATAGELDLASAADIASNVLSGFRLETDQTGRVTDVLAAIAAKTNTSVSQMGVALAKAAPSARAAGWSLEQTAAAIGRLSDAGIQGEEAGTVLKTMLARLAAPTGKLEKLMAKTGITVKNTTTGAMLPLNDIIAQLAPHADNTGLMFELLGTRGANAGLILGSLASDDLANLTAELENSEGASQKMADIMSGGLWGSIKAIQSIVESAYISFGERFTPTVQKLAKVFAKLPSPIQEVVVVVGSLAGAMGGLMLLMPGAFGAITTLPGKLVQLTGKIYATATSMTALSVAFKAAWRALMGPIGWAIAIGAATVGLYKFWKATNAPDNKLKRFEKQLEQVNQKLIKFAKTSPRLVTELGFQKKALERQIAALKKSHPELDQNAESLAGIIGALHVLGQEAAPIPRVIAKIGLAADQTDPELVDLTTALETFGLIAKRTPPPIHNLSDELDWLKERFDKVQTVPIGDFLADLGIVAEDSGLQVLTLEETFGKTERTSKKLDVTLAAVAGQLGGDAGQSINVFQSMLQTNDALKEGEKGFSKIQQGAALVSAGFHAVGEAVGGMAGKVLSSLGNIASAFATGGIVGGIMAGIGSLVKGIGGLFSRGRKKREEAARREMKAVEERAARMRELAEAQESYWDSVYGSAINAYDRASAAGVAAYDDIMQAAIESGVGQEIAVGLAEKAQVEATRKVLAAEGEKYARLAAFEAALEAIRSGNAAGAAEAAVTAAANTRAAWETAMHAVTVAADAAKNALVDTDTKLAAINARTAAALSQQRAAALVRWEAEDREREYDDEMFEFRQHGGAGAGRSALRRR